MVAMGVGGGESLAEWAWKVLHDCSLTKDKIVEHICDSVHLEDFFYGAETRCSQHESSSVPAAEHEARPYPVHAHPMRPEARKYRGWAETMLRRSGTVRGTSSSRHGHRHDSVTHTSI
ncbi:hypothetical protein VPH35_092212 [Triticum aestivum]